MKNGKVFLGDLSKALGLLKVESQRMQGERFVNNVPIDFERYGKVLFCMEVVSVYIRVLSSLYQQSTFRKEGSPLPFADDSMRKMFMIPWRLSNPPKEYLDFMEDNTKLLLQNMVDNGAAKVEMDEGMSFESLITTELVDTCKSIEQLYFELHDYDAAMGLIESSFLAEAY